MSLGFVGRGDPVTKRGDATAVGSSETFEDFYEREFPAVVELAPRCRGADRVRRAGQEAFLLAHRDWDRLGPCARPDVWVRRVVANLSVSALRRRVVEAKTLARIALGYSGRCPSSRPRRRGGRAVRSLPARQAQVVALHYLEDRPVAEIAERLGTAEGAVREAPVRRTASPRPPSRARGGRRMTLDTRARRAAQGIHRAVEVMEMSISTREPRKIARSIDSGIASNGTGGPTRSSSPRYSPHRDDRPATKALERRDTKAP